MSGPPRSLSAFQRRRNIIMIIGGFIAAVTAGLITFVALHKPAPAIAYTNLSRNYRVCLLTTHDTADNTKIWGAIQAATDEVAINAQHITAPPGTPDQLAPYLNSLIAMKCGLIITPDSDLTDATTNAARTNPTQHFITSTNHAKLANVDALPATPGALTTVIVNAEHGNYPTTK